MACQTKPYLLSLFFIEVTIMLLRVCVSTRSEPQVPCYFIFGDSLVDSGNNNHLVTQAKVDYFPYGIDFPLGPTGRFCNGRTTADIIGELLGFDDFIPSFLMVSNNSNIIKGVNYASGSAGIQEETGKIMGDNIDLEKQVQNHKVTISRITEMVGNTNETTTKHLHKCLYLFVIGSNDYIINYFLPNYYNTSTLYSLEQFADVLIQQYSQHIKTVYDSGARKVALTGIGPIGCTPGAIASHDTNGSSCVDLMNKAANLFNNKLQLLVNHLNTNFTDATFLYVEAFGFLSDFIASPVGALVKISECCATNEDGLCIPNGVTCVNRNLNLFWDMFHPTEIANRIGGGLSYLAMKNILY